MKKVKSKNVPGNLLVATFEVGKHQERMMHVFGSSTRQGDARGRVGLLW